MFFHDMKMLERVFWLKRIKGGGNPMHEATSTSGSFVTDVVEPLKKLLLTLEPIQSGSGTPSPDNPRPISGHTECVTEVCGKNLLDVSTAYKFIGYNASAGTNLSPKIADYQWEENGDTLNIYLRDWRQAGFISKKLPLGKVKLTLENVTGLLRCSVYVCDENFTINRVSMNYNPIDVGTNVEIDTTFAGTDAYLAVYLGGNDQDASLSKPRIYVGENASDTDYEPYQGTTYTTDLGRTVYGADVEQVGGQLTDKMGMVVLDGTQAIDFVNWRPSATSVGWIYKYSVTNHAVPTSSAGVAKIVSDKLMPCSYNDSYAQTFDNSISTYSNTAYGLVVRMNDTSLTTKDAINAYLAQNPITVVYELATPQTYQLDPQQQINSLVGQNNIITEDGVEVSEVVYMTRLVGSPLLGSPQTEDESTEETNEEPIEETEEPEGE